MNRNLSFDTMRRMAILFVLTAHFLTNSVVFDDYSTTMLGNTSLNFSFFGSILYSLYLVHAPIGYSLFYFIAKNFTEDFVDLKIIFVTSICILIAMFSYKFIESIYFKGIK